MLLRKLRRRADSPAAAIRCQGFQFEQLRRGLENVDHNGGSSLLEIVLRDMRGRKLASNEAYEHLWRLQHSLERNPEVDAVLSLPMLMAEGKDSLYGHFILRMREIGRDVPRAEIIDQIGGDHAPARLHTGSCWALPI